MNLRKGITLLIIFLLQNNVTIPSEKSKYPTEKYYPLGIGYSWKYKGKLLGQSVEKKITIEKKEGLFFIDNTGAMLMHDEEGLRDNKRYLIKNPIKKGNKWISIISPQSTEHYEIIQTDIKAKYRDEIIKNCIKIRSINKIDPTKDMVAEWIYAPNIGLLNFSTYILRNKKDWEQQGYFELIEFSRPDESQNSGK
ncbi:MAG: hypothetical protein N2746_10575 [Deltaproteobacteria bacterium]|nr:hypothetical protein [Deltaproteobacteria bacterium]